ncbi:TetR/AcrR family transcriptional regulator [Williamsia soli]|uniref:TetR/AcrR family transcriptional regulator n=1 Tax=Williamsia soli TaxID=364929 RepID=UPI001A9E2703|nr:TetR/AcrR family transcriptional regulator [Williamsia soli]
MPRNNQTVPKAERAAAVVDCAVTLFTEFGYRATSVAAVGRAAGLTTAAVHWYYATKDDLFAAALDQMFADTRREIEADPSIAGDPYGELNEFFETLAPFRSLHREAYERMDDSEALRAVYADTQLWLEERFMAVVADNAPHGADLVRMTEAAHLFFEGLMVSVRRIEKPASYYLDMTVAAVIGAATVTPLRRK